MPDELYYDDNNLPQFLSNANRFTNDAVYSSKSEKSHSKKVSKKDKKKSGKVKKAKKVSHSPPAVKVPRAKPIKIQKSFPPKPKAELAAEKAIIMEKFNAKTRKEARAEEKRRAKKLLELAEEANRMARFLEKEAKRKAEEQRKKYI